MEKLPMCRICLAENVRMHKVVNRNLHELYEKLTDIPFVTEDSRPILACFFCYTKLKQYYRFLRKCLQAEELFAQMMNEDYERNPLINESNLEEISGFIISPIVHVDIVDECQTESIDIKEELPDVCDESIEPAEEHQIEELEPGSFDNSGLDVADIPPHHSDSDVEDDIIKLNFIETEVEKEQEVSQNKQAAGELKQLEPETFDNSGLDVADIPPHHSESNVEDNIIKEVEEKQEVPLKKRTAGDKKRLSRDLRERIIALRARGCRVSDICRHTGITKKTFYFWLRRWEQSGSLEGHYRQDYPRATTEADDAAIVAAHSADPFQSTRVTSTSYKEADLNIVGKRQADDDDSFS